MVYKPRKAQLVFPRELLSSRLWSARVEALWAPSFFRIISLYFERSASSECASLESTS